MSRLRTDRALYLDLELTCWDGQAPEGMEPEIIQVGIVEADLTTLSITRRAGYYVRPVRSTVSEYCTKLTGITQEQVRKHGRPFTEVLNSLTKTFGPRTKLCYAWGNDEAAIAEACLETSTLSPFHMIDFGLQFCIEYGLKESMSLTNALKYIGRASDGRAHDAVIDAMNTSALHLMMLDMNRHRSPCTVFRHQMDCEGRRLYPIGYFGCFCKTGPLE